MLFQETWTRAYGWDTVLEDDLARRWKTWLLELKDLNMLNILRHSGMNANVNTQLHDFSDASKEAFSPTVYARSELPKGDVVVRLVATKSRVSPLR